MRVMLTERLRLEPVSALNADQLWQILQAADLRAFQDLPGLRLTAFVESVSRRPLHLGSGQHGRYEWLVVLRESGENAGWISLRIPEREPGAAEVGYTLLAEFRGRGYATEAVSALIEEAFAAVHLQRLCAYCVPQNFASIAVLERLGFTRDMILPRGATVGGQPVDVIAHVLEAREWREGPNRTLMSAEAKKK
ncbi:MAG: GNAT family N-acetyltransferase [Candidatus Eremiobacteraeota bacterium]|nr:GNAT family N-acetyltransferase [Candidatus Eremiobacteraeota bacterium]